jgi:hypothetical protein
VWLISNLFPGARKRRFVRNLIAYNQYDTALIMSLCESAFPSEAGFKPVSF